MLLLVAAACQSRALTPGPAQTSGPSRSSLPALKLAVLSAVGGRLTYCDPDEYPLAHGTPLENARARLPAIRADRAAFTAILEHEALTPDQQLTPVELVAVSQDYKQMQAIQLEPAQNGYRFSVLVPATGAPSGNQSVSGTVDLSGAVRIEQRGAGRPLSCPICLAAGVRIDTPSGSIPVQELAVGTAVWTTDLHGRRIRAVVLQKGEMEAPVGHEVVRLTLADGRTVLVSPGHPTADGRTVGELKPGDRLSGSRVLAAVLVPYSAGTTYDLLPSGPTGTYFANGVLLGSTLLRQAPPARSR